MSRTTQCPNCRVVLTVPDNAVHRRLKCPKCATKFHTDTEDSTPPRSAPAMDSAGPASATFPTMPTSKNKEVDLPVISGSLRDTFDLPLLEDSSEATAP